MGRSLCAQHTQHAASLYREAGYLTELIPLVNVAVDLPHVEQHQCPGKPPMNPEPGNMRPEPGPIPAMIFPKMRPGTNHRAGVEVSPRRSIPRRSVHGIQTTRQIHWNANMSAPRREIRGKHRHQIRREGHVEIKPASVGGHNFPKVEGGFHIVPADSSQASHRRTHRQIISGPKLPCLLQNCKRSLCLDFLTEHLDQHHDAVVV